MSSVPDEATENLNRLASSQPSPGQKIPKLRTGFPDTHLLKFSGQGHDLFLKPINPVENFDLLTSEKSSGPGLMSLLLGCLRSKQAQGILQEFFPYPGGSIPVMLIKAASFLGRELLSRDCGTQYHGVSRVLPSDRHQDSCRAVGPDPARLHLPSNLIREKLHHFKPISYPTLTTAEAPRERAQTQSLYLRQFPDQEALFPGGEPGGGHSHPKLEESLLGAHVQD